MKHVLWLASWYPDPLYWHNGDFVQRHAQAVAEQMPLTVIHVLQHGPGHEMKDDAIETQTQGGLTEMLVSFRYKKTASALWNKIIYNWKFYKRYKEVLQQYIAQHGKPDLVHVHIPMKAGRMAIWLKKKYGIPYIVTEHSSAYSDEVPDNYKNRGGYYRKWVKSIFEQAEAVTTVSEKLGGLLKQLFAVKHMHIIPNVVNTRYFHLFTSRLPKAM